MQRLLACFCASLALLWVGKAVAQEPSQSPCTNKQVRTAAQKKIASLLLCELYPTQGPRRLDSIEKDETGRVLVDVRTTDLSQTVTKVVELGGEVTYQSERHHTIQAWVPMNRIEDIAELPAVRAIQPRSAATTNPR